MMEHIQNDNFILVLLFYIKAMPCLEYILFGSFIENSL